MKFRSFYVFMKVFCSGISGAGASDYIAKVVDYAKGKGEEIKFFDVGKEVLNAAKRSGYPVTAAGVLDLDKRALTYLTLAAYETIAREVSNHQNSIIDAHIHFCWRGVLTDSVKPEMVKALNPDIYVTLMDLAHPIMERLEADAAWQNQVKNEGLNKTSILHLQTTEVSTTKQWAAFFEKPMYVLPSKDSPDSLYKLAIRKEIEVAYVSFPITSFHDDPESQQKIDNFVDSLRRFKNLAIISPRALVLGTNPTKVESQHTVMHDLEWLVGGSTQRIFVYFPKNARSSGVHSEATKAKGSCKEVWFIGPPDMKDPFTDSTIHHRFDSPDECIEKLLQSGMERE